jgi:hypothetical protein
MRRVSVKALTVATVGGLTAAAWLSVASGPTSTGGLIAAMGAGMVVGAFLAGGLTWALSRGAS